jgi:hypothetical protein
MTGGQADGRSGGRRLWSAATTLGALVLLTASPPDRLTAQVGYPPDHSPYRDIRGGNTIVLSGGYLSGTRGLVGVIPSNGNVYSFRYERPLGRTIGVMLNVADAQTSRFVIDPTKDSVSRTTGPVTNAVAILDVGLYMILTGGKSWHGLAPYIGASAGAAVGSRPAGDTSSYTFGTRFEFWPEAGLRVHLARRLSLRASGRLVFWKVSYPLQYKQPGPDGSRVIAVDGPSSEWSEHPLFSLGLGWTF